ncbi:MAG TPA: FHA domain-containing protein [Actinomycetota bacterium]|nr:FHA domain-containing protein [Actinomycetota bacterium]
MGDPYVRNAYLELLGPRGASMVLLDKDRIAIGKTASNDAPVPWDHKVSRLHAVVERYASGWCVRDVGSRNGTFLNGERIVGDRVLRPGDEIRIGETRLLFKFPATASTVSVTESAKAPPELTRRERDVLVALCRPILSRTMLSEPAGNKNIARELVLTDSTVKKHLQRLYDKFEILDPDERRRGHLVAEAIRRGAVSAADL